MSKLTLFLAKHFVRKLIEESYRKVDHRFAIRHILETVLHTQQEYFREDNEPTAVDFIIEQLVRVSELKPSWDYYKMLRPNDVLCPICKGNRVQECGQCNCKACGGTGIKEYKI